MFIRGHQRILQVSVMLIGGSHLFIPKGRRGTLPGIVLVSFIHFPFMFMRCFLVLRALLLTRAARDDNSALCCHEGKALKSYCLFHVIWIFVFRIFWIIYILFIFPFPPL